MMREPGAALFLSCVLRVSLCRYSRSRATVYVHPKGLKYNNESGIIMPAMVI